jgi:hypothetical protein
MVQAQLKINSLYEFTRTKNLETYDEYFELTGRAGNNHFLDYYTSEYDFSRCLLCAKIGEQGVTNIDLVFAKRSADIDGKTEAIIMSLDVVLKKGSLISSNGTLKYDLYSKRAQMVVGTESCFLTLPDSIIETEIKTLNQRLGPLTQPSFIPKEYSLKKMTELLALLDSPTIVTEC